MLMGKKKRVGILLIAVIVLISLRKERKQSSYPELTNRRLLTTHDMKRKNHTGQRMSRKLHPTSFLLLKKVFLADIDAILLL